MKCTLKEVQNNVMEILKVVIEICDNNNIMYYAQAGTVLGTVRHKGPIPWDYDADIIVPDNQIDQLAECLNENLMKEFYVDYFKIDRKSKRQFPRVGLKGYSTEILHLDIFRMIGLPDERCEQEKHLAETKAFEKKAACLRTYPVWKLIAKGKFQQAVEKMGLAGNDIGYYIDHFDKMCSKYSYDIAKYVANPSGKYGVKNIFPKEVYGEGIMMDFIDFKIRIPSLYKPYLQQYYGDYMQIPCKEYIDREMNRIFVVK